MAEKLGILNQLLFGDWAERSTINRNAEHLSTVEANVSALREIVALQADEIMQLRAILKGVIEVVRAKTPFDDTELERAVNAAWAELSPPEPPKAPTDPYRSLPVDVSAADVDAAKALLATAQDHHFSRRFQEARAVYQQVVDQYGNTKQAETARQQLDNLRKS